MVETYVCVYRYCDGDYYHVHVNVHDNHVRDHCKRNTILHKHVHKKKKKNNYFLYISKKQCEAGKNALKLEFLNHGRLLRFLIFCYYRFLLLIFL